MQHAEVKRKVAGGCHVAQRGWVSVEQLCWLYDFCRSPRTWLRQFSFHLCVDFGN